MAWGKKEERRGLGVQVQNIRKEKNVKIKMRVVWERRERDRERGQ